MKNDINIEISNIFIVIRKIFNFVIILIKLNWKVVFYNFLIFIRLYFEN